MESNYFFNLINYLTENIPYLSFDASSFDKDFKSIDSHSLLQEFLQNVKFSIVISSLPTPFKETIDELMNETKESPVSIFEMNYSMRLGIGYTLDNNPHFGTKQLCVWLLKIQHPRQQEIEFKWIFSDEKGRKLIMKEFTLEHYKKMRKLRTKLGNVFSSFQNQTNNIISEHIKTYEQTNPFVGTSTLESPARKIHY